jgi:hypothetical protein
VTHFALPAAEAGVDAGNYILAILVSAGLVVMVVALLSIPAVRTVPGGPRKRWAQVVSALVALVIPVFIGGQATVHYIDGLNDFTAVPAICASDSLSQDRVADFISSPPEPEENSDADHASCDWERTADAEDGSDAAELYIRLRMYDDSRVAADRIQSPAESAQRDGEAVVDLQLGDDAVRRTFDGAIGDEDSRGVAVEVRIDNVVLSAKFEHSAGLGTPDPDNLEALATELAREIERRQPDRWR